MQKLYTMKENGGGGALPMDPALAVAYNSTSHKLGVFWTLHEFDGPRQKQHISHLNGFAVDIDTGNKQESFEIIKRGLWPTWLIETKNGYHVYWLFKEPVEVAYSQELDDRYAHTMTNRIIPFYTADNKAKDLARLLRVPYFMHWKDPNDPFLVKPINENPVCYTWEQIDWFYPDVLANNQLKQQVAAAKRTLKLPSGSDLFDRIYRMDCKQALEVLSGSAHVGGDVYTFRRTAGGAQNIFSNGKGTSCWVDTEGRIGSLDKGGPTIWGWLFWYHRDHKKVYQIMKEVFHVS